MTNIIEYSNPKVWGSHFWFMMRAIAHTYPDDPTRSDKKHAYNFFNELKYNLPCEQCRVHYGQVLKIYNIKKYLSNTASLVQWVSTIYDYIEAHKNDGKMDRDVVREKSKKNRGKEKDKKHKAHKADKEKDHRYLARATNSGHVHNVRKTPRCKSCQNY
jgi:hypothetical protein